MSEPERNENIEPAEGAGAAVSRAQDVDSMPSNSPSAAPPVSPARSTEPSSLSLLFLVFSVLVLASWFVGPRLVEEYHYASAKGKLRAEYENAVAFLEEHPLKKVSMASRMVAQKVKPSVVSIRARKVGEREPTDQWLSLIHI